MGRRRSITIGSWNPEQTASPRGVDALVRDFLLITEDLTRAEVARLAGVSEPTLRKWERGTFRNLPRNARERMLGYLEENGFGSEAVL